MKKVDKDKWKLQGENRRFSTREVARIQTFPDWFTFYSGDGNVLDNTRLDKIYKQIGNAVPVILAKEVIMPITKFFIEKNKFN